MVYGIINPTMEQSGLVSIVVGAGFRTGLDYTQEQVRNKLSRI